MKKFHQVMTVSRNQSKIMVLEPKSSEHLELVALLVPFTFTRFYFKIKNEVSFNFGVVFYYYT